MIRRGHKYSARPERIAGRYFGSQGEARRFADLQLEEKAGEIRGLEHQSRVIELAGCVKYRPDYAYEVGARVLGGWVWQPVIEDHKGMETERFKLICQLWPLWGPCPLHISKVVDRRRGTIDIVRTILPQPQARAAWLRAALATLEAE